MFKVGDKVRIKEGLKQGNIDINDASFYISDEMVRMCGKEYMINRVYENLVSKKIHLKIKGWCFTEDMVTKAREKNEI